MKTKEVQKRVFDNKVKHGFNLTDIILNSACCMVR